MLDGCARKKFIWDCALDKIMALKQTSSEVQISAGVTESAANTFTQIEVDLSLSPLDNEIFVVTAIDLDLQAPDAIAATDTDFTAYVSTTSQTATVGIDNSNVLTSSRKDIRAVSYTHLTLPTKRIV